MPLSEAAISHRKEQAKEYYSRVKEKRKIQQREWYLRNKEKRLEASRKWQRENRDRINKHRRENPQIYSGKLWRSKNPEKNRESQRAAGIKKRFGITAAQYDSMISVQDGKCAICKLPPTGKRSKSKLHLDHCHETGRLRGFICGHCNTGLGMARDSIEILEAMISYLRDYRKDFQK